MSNDDGITLIDEDTSPVANDNGPYTADEGSPITFDASGSTDPDGDTCNIGGISIMMGYGILFCRVRQQPVIRGMMTFPEMQWLR